MAKNAKAISDEEIIAAIMQHGTIKAAAAAVGTNTRTIYDRMKDADFRAAYMGAKNDIIRKAVFNINEKLSAAIDTVSDIMTDTDTPPAIRLQAAQTIITNAEKFAGRLTREEYQARMENKPPFELDF